MLAGGDAEGEILKNRIVAAVSKAHVLKHHLAGFGAMPLRHRPMGRRTALRRGQIGDLNRLL